MSQIKRLKIVIVLVIAAAITLSMLAVAIIKDFNPTSSIPPKEERLPPKEERLLRLTIDMKQKTYFINPNEIWVDIELINIGNKTTHVLECSSCATFLKIKTPTNEIRYAHDWNTTSDPYKYIYLNPNESHKYRMEIVMNLNIPFDWNTTGNYSVRASYYELGNFSLTSNEVQFNITDRLMFEIQSHRQFRSSHRMSDSMSIPTTLIAAEGWFTRSLHFTTLTSRSPSHSPSHSPASSRTSSHHQGTSRAHLD